MRARKQAAFWIAFLLPTLAWADSQPTPPNHTPEGYDVLIDNASVQKELKLSEEQVTRVTEMRQQVKDKILVKSREQPSNSFKKTKPVDLQANARELSKAASEETWKGLQDILKPGQLKRLKQIQLQREGFNTLFDPEVAKTLALTEEQKKKIEGIQEYLKKQSTALFKTGPQTNFQSNLKKITTLRREALDKALALLSPEQMKSWTDLAGDPFEMKSQPFMLRRPGIGK